MIKKDDKSIILFDISLFSGPMSELLAVLLDQLSRSRTDTRKVLTVVTPNPEQVVLTRNNPKFLHALQAADVRIPDGIGMIYASKILSSRIGQPKLRYRLPGRVVVQQLLAAAHQKSLTVLVVGGRDLGGNHRIDASPELRLLRPVSGTQDTFLSSTRWFWTEGFTNVDNPTELEEKALANVLQTIRPDILFVAFGAPHQEIWLDMHRDLLEKNGVRLAMAVGGTFDVLSGALQPPPDWMQAAGLEWLFRLWQQPSRWKRQLRLVTFMKLVWQTLH